MRRMWMFSMGLAGLLLGGACAGGITSDGFGVNAPPSSRGEATGEGVEVDWSRPLVAGDSVATQSAADSLLVFPSVMPSSLGGPTLMVVSDTKTNNPVQRVLAIVYDHPSYGRFWVKQQVPQVSPAELEAQVAVCEASPLCDGLTTESLGLLVRGLIGEGAPATFVTWISGGVSFDVLGPYDTLSADEAKEIASELLTTQSAQG